MRIFGCWAEALTSASVTWDCQQSAEPGRVLERLTARNLLARSPAAEPSPRVPALLDYVLAQPGISAKELKISLRAAQDLVGTPPA